MGWSRSAWAPHWRRCNHWPPRRSSWHRSRSASSRGWRSRAPRPWDGTAAGLLLSAGIVTAIPLLFFAAAARRVPLVTIGLLQFMTPVLQLLCGVLLLGEHVAPALWVGFGIVWVALALLTLDSLRSARAGRAQVARTDLEDPEP